LAGCRFDLDELVVTEQEFLENLQSLNCTQKLRDRVANLTRRAFRLYRGITIADLLVQRRKQRKKAREMSIENHA
jgi:hypothetical protein